MYVHRLHHLNLYYLDTTVFKDSKNTTPTKVLFKPTDIPQLLHKHSCHLKHTFKCLLRSQLIYFIEYVQTKRTLKRHGVFFFKPSVKKLL